ncbi:MAG: glycosyltransferase family 4 protein [Anaerocolumna sp.]
MSKILIYMDKKEIAPVGGPKGYIFNLKQQLDTMEAAKNINYLCSFKSVTTQVNKKIERIKNIKIQKLLIIIKSIYKKERLLHGHKHRAAINLNDYDLIHFHSTMDMYSIRDDLEDYKGIVALTSHSPTILSKEVFDRVTNFEKKFLKKSYKNLINMDIYAFNRADYLFFPCQEAEEPYYHSWPYYKTFKKKNLNKYRYLLTGINQCTYKLNRAQICNKYNIPETAFIISYAGRHNEIKGYDVLKEIAVMLFGKYDNVYFLIAGKEGPLTRLEHKNWIEIGWTADPHSIISASDLFILPNKETYFDLILLEILSLGKIIVASKTGGNKYFEKFNNCGIFLYKNIEESIRQIEDIMKMDKDSKNMIEASNSAIYKNYFTSEVFARNYISLIQSILT